MAKIVMELRSGNYGFEARDEKGHVLHTDSSKENGGEDGGFRPMQLLLTALGGCSAIDMVSILKKQKQKIDSFVIEIEGEREAGALPSLWKTVRVLYTLKGTVDAEKANKAAALSIEKYCSVAETLRRGGTEISWMVVVEQ